jgi:hypothetical protein
MAHQVAGFEVLVKFLGIKLSNINFPFGALSLRLLVLLHKFLLRSNSPY